jgi:hypothetical protein
LVRTAEEEVDARVTIVRVELLPDFGVAGERALMLDRKGIAQTCAKVRLVDARPLPRHLGLARKSEQRRDITLLERPEHDASATELHVPTIPPGSTPDVTHSIR